MINGSSTFWSIQFLASLIFLILVVQSLLDIFSNFFRLFDVPDWLNFLVAATEYFSVKLKFSDHAVFNYVKYYAYVLLSVIGCFIIYLVGDYIYSDVTRKDLKNFLINCESWPKNAIYLFVARKVVLRFRQSKNNTFSAFESIISEFRIYKSIRYVPALWRDLTFVPEIVILSKPDPKTGIRLKIVQNEKAA